MTIFGDTPQDEGSEAAAWTAARIAEGEHPPASSESPERVGRLRRLLRIGRRALRPLTKYPRVTIEAVLTGGALLAGLLILPPLTAAAPGRAAIDRIALIRPPPTPAYLLYDIYPGGETVVLGFDTTVKEDWGLVIIYDPADHIVEGKTHNATFGQRLSAKYINSGNGDVGLYVHGMAKPGFHSYSEFQNGYYSVFSQHFNIFKGGGLPVDDAVINFQITGPVPLAYVTGASEAITLPQLVYKDFGSGKNADFRSEMFYDAGTYQNQTGGATIQGGEYWDWLTDGLFPGTVATGVDNAKLQTEQNQTFIAAAMFGLAAAGAAGLCLEIVDVVEIRRQARREGLPE
jgi:hypothetical protein